MKISVTLIIFFLIAGFSQTIPQAQAFETYGGAGAAHPWLSAIQIGNHVGLPIHQDITKEGLDFLNNNIKTTLADQHLFMEANQTSIYHFDNCAFSGTVNNINQRYQTAVSKLNPSNPDLNGAAEEFGRLLHQAQDFYSHSNWVEMHRTDLIDDTYSYWRDISSFSYSGNENPVFSLEVPADGNTKSTIYSRNYNEKVIHVKENNTSYPTVGLVSGTYGDGMYNRCPSDASIPHGSVIGPHFSFADAEKLNEPDALNKDHPKRTGHKIARELATEQTTHEFCRLVELTRASWGDAGVKLIYDNWVENTNIANSKCPIPSSKTGISDTGTFVEDKHAMVLPSWFKTNAKWWNDGLISDKDIVLAIGNLIDQNIITVKQTNTSQKTDSVIPSYIKSVFNFWSENKVSDSDIANSLQYLLEHGIIKSNKLSENQETSLTPDKTKEDVNCGGDDQATGSFNSTPLSEKDKTKYKKVEDKITILKQPTKMTCAPTVGAMMILHKNSTVSPGVYKGTTSDLIDSLKKSMGTDEIKGSKPDNIANGIEKWLKGKENGKNLSVKYTSESAKDGDLSGTIKFQKVGEITPDELLSELNNGENIMVMAKDDKGNKHALFIIGIGDKPNEDGKTDIAYVDPRRGMIQGTVGYGNVIIDETNDETWDPLAKVSIVPTLQAPQPPGHAMVLDKNQADHVTVMLLAHEKATETLLEIFNHNAKMYADLADAAWDSYDASKDPKTMQQATNYTQASKTSASDAKTTVKLLNSARNQVKLHEDVYDPPTESSGMVYSNFKTLSGFGDDKIESWNDLIGAFGNAQEAIKIGHKNYQQLVSGMDPQINLTVLMNSDKDFWKMVCKNPEQLTVLPFSSFIQDPANEDFQKRCWAYQTIFDGPPKLDGLPIPPQEAIPSAPSTPESGGSFTVTPLFFSWVHNIGGTTCPQDVTNLFLNTPGQGTVTIITKPTYLDVTVSGSTADVNFNCILSQYNSQTLSGNLVFAFTNANDTSNTVKVSYTGQINKP